MSGDILISSQNSRWNILGVSLIPHTQSITKAFWLGLQNISRIWPLFFISTAAALISPSFHHHVTPGILEEHSKRSPCFYLSSHKPFPTQQLKQSLRSTFWWLPISCRVKHPSFIAAHKAPHSLPHSPPFHSTWSPRTVSSLTPSTLSPCWC